MINRTHRFHGYNSLRGVYQRGQSVRGQMVSLKFVRREASKPYRAAVIVSRKVSKSAVVRGRIRRRIYEIVRRADVGIAPGTDLVFTVFGERLHDISAPELQAIIDDLLQKATGGRTSSAKTPAGRAIVKGKDQDTSAPRNLEGK